MYYIMSKHNEPKYTKEEWIDKAKQIKPQYDYSKSVYKNKRTKVLVTCLKHGDFLVNPSYYLSSPSCTCPKCQEEIRIKEKNEKYLNLVKELYKDRDYSFEDFKYSGSRCKVKINCKKHGQFESSLTNIVFSHTICPKCAIEEQTERMRLKYDDFVRRSIEIHGDKYIYKKENFTSYDEPMIITCPIHGDFKQRPHNHLHGNGCPICSSERGGIKGRNNADEMLKKCMEAHKSDNYTYEYFRYTKCSEKIAVHCHNTFSDGTEHGIFYQRPLLHLNGQGCPKCNVSLMERNVHNAFLDKGLEVVCQHSFEWLINDKTNHKMTLDFYIPSLDIAIECQGKQHFIPIKHFGGDDELEWVKYKDALKRALCKSNNVELIYFLPKEYNSFLDCENKHFNDVVELMEYITSKKE